MIAELPTKSAFFWNGVADLDKADADYLVSRGIASYEKKDAFGLRQPGDEPDTVIDEGGNKVPDPEATKKAVSSKTEAK